MNYYEWSLFPYSDHNMALRDLEPHEMAFGLEVENDRQADQGKLSEWMKEKFSQQKETQDA